MITQLSLQSVTQVFATTGLSRPQDSLATGPARFVDHAGQSQEQIGHFVTADAALRASRALSETLKTPGRIPGADAFEALGRKPHYYRFTAVGPLPSLETGWLLVNGVDMGLYLSANEVLRYQGALAEAHQNADRKLLHGLRVLLEPRSVYPALPDLSALGVKDPIDRAIAASMVAGLLREADPGIEKEPLSLRMIGALWGGLDSIGWLNWIGETETDLGVMLTDEQLFEQNSDNFDRSFPRLLAVFRACLGRPGLPMS